jgi:hypothetical protein
VRMRPDFSPVLTNLGRNQQWTLGYSTWLTRYEARFFNRNLDGYKRFFYQG